MLRLCEDELAYFQSTSDQEGPNIPTQPSPSLPPAGPESQEVPFLAPKPPPESTLPAALASELTPQPDPITAETVTHLLREHEDLVREWEEFRLQAERACPAEELLRSGLPETFGRSLHDAKFELTMECQMIDMGSGV